MQVKVFDRIHLKFFISTTDFLMNKHQKTASATAKCDACGKHKKLDEMLVPYTIEEHERSMIQEDCLIELVRKAINHFNHSASNPHHLR